MPIKFRLPGARLVSGGVFVSCRAGTGAILAFLLFGRPLLLYTEESVQRADAIVVFPGKSAERLLEARDLYRGGYAPLIVLTREARDGGQQWPARNGAPLSDRADLAHGPARDGK